MPKGDDDLDAVLVPGKFRPCPDVIGSVGWGRSSAAGVPLVVPQGPVRTRELARDDPVHQVNILALPDAPAEAGHGVPDLPAFLLDAIFG